MSDQGVRLWERLAERASLDMGYIGYVLDRYCAIEGLPLQSLSGLLRVDERTLPGLRLCRRPRADRFAEDLNAVAVHVGADATALAAILRHVDAVDTMAGETTRERGFLLAARARLVTPSDDEGGSGAEKKGQRPAPREDDRRARAWRGG